MCQHGHSFSFETLETDQRDRRDGELRVRVVALPLPAPSLPAKRQKLLVWEVICLPRERPNSSTSRSDDGASKSASGGYRRVEPAVAVTCGFTTPRRLCL